MNDLFTELDKLTGSNIDFTLPDIGIDIINSTSDNEAEEI